MAMFLPVAAEALEGTVVATGAGGATAAAGTAAAGAGAGAAGAGGGAAGAGGSRLLSGMQFGAGSQTAQNLLGGGGAKGEGSPQDQVLGGSSDWERS